MYVHLLSVFIIIIIIKGICTYLYENLDVEITTQLIDPLFKSIGSCTYGVAGGWIDESVIMDW